MAKRIHRQNGPWQAVEARRLVGHPHESLHDLDALRLLWPSPFTHPGWMQAWHEVLAPRTHLWVRTFWEGGKPIGLAPLRGAVREMAENPKLYPSVRLLYGARTPGDILYTDELQRWASHLHMKVQVTVDRAASASSARSSSTATSPTGSCTRSWRRPISASIPSSATSSRTSRP